MENILEIKGLKKEYKDFSLHDISFSLPMDCITGFIGVNGAGKTTTLKAILSLIPKESGSVQIFGMDMDTNEKAIKERIGIVLDDGGFYDELNLSEMKSIIASAYKSWDELEYKKYLDRFSLNPKQKISTLSKGMRMKYALALALSHKAELLIMDEPTSGLDPVVRDEVLDLFYDFMQEDSHAILLSSHITSDLDKIADHITFIHQGRVLLSEPRDELLDTFGVLRCTAEQLSALEPSAVRAKRIGAFGCEALVRRGSVPANWPVEAANIEQIMLFLTRGEETR